MITKKQFKGMIEKAEQLCYEDEEVKVDDPTLFLLSKNIKKVLRQYKE